MTPTATTRAGKPVGRVAFVGAGPGDPGLVTLRARDRLAAADTILIDQLNRDELIARFAGSDVTLVDAGHGEHGEELTRASRAKLDTPIGRRELRGVAEQVRQHLTNPARVGAYPQLGIGLDGHVGVDQRGATQPRPLDHRNIGVRQQFKQSQWID